MFPLSHPSCCVGLSGGRCLLCAGARPCALLLLQPLEQEQHVVCELVPWPPHPAELHRVQAGVGGPVLLGAAHLTQEQPGAVRVHVHQVQENTLESSRKRGKKCKDKALWLAPNGVLLGAKESFDAAGNPWQLHKFSSLQRAEQCPPCPRKQLCVSQLKACGSRVFMIPHSHLRTSNKQLVQN